MTTMRLLAALALLLALPAAAQDLRAGDLTITRPWSRPALQDGTGAGFMTLRATGEGDRLLAATSPAARTVELHTHVNDNGVMRMRPVPEIAVPAGGAVSLQPGGLHVMLIGLTRPLRAGDRVPVTLTFARAGSVAVELVVEGRAAGGGHAH